MFFRFYADTLGVLLPLLVLLLMSGCERASLLEDNEPAEATLSTIQTRIFDTSCAFSGCHGGSSPQLGMSLEDGMSFASLVNVASQERSDLMRVNPGNPEESYLLKKVRGDADIVAAQMPLGRSELSTENIELIRQWIEDGAMNN